MKFTTLFNIPEDNPVLNVIYKELKDFNGHYLIGNNGTILNRTKTLKTYINNSGYECIKLTALKSNKHRLIHRLVAETFIPNPDNKPEVNHKDGNKLNNTVENLEWVTSSENKRHSLVTGIRKYNNPTLGKKLSKNSKYHNVTYDKQRNKWVASVRHNGRNYFQKRFNTEEEAALHVNWILDELKLSDRPKNII